MPDLPAAIIHHRRWIAAAFIVVAIVLLPQVPQLSSKLAVGSAGVQSSEAEQVNKLLATGFTTPFADSLVLVITGSPSLDDVDGVDVLLEVVDAIKPLEQVTGVLSYLNTVDSAFRSPHGTFVIVGIKADALRRDKLLLDLRAATGVIQASLREDFPLIELAWTGSAAFDYDVRLTSAQDAATAEKRVLPVTLVLLLLIFGSIVAALCPVLIGGLGVSLSLGAAAIISTYWPLTVLLPNIVSMIGLGIGIDYSLLMLSRFREEMAIDPRPEQAALQTLRTAGHTVLISGGAVAIGFAALLLVPATELRSIATGGLLVVAFSVMLATLLLPAILVWLGTRVEGGRLRRPRSGLTPPQYWYRWGGWVSAHPLLVLLVVGLPLAFLALQARHISTDIPSGSWLPERMESTRGAIALQRIGQSGLISTIRVVTEFSAGDLADSESGWQAVISLSNHFAADDRVARVHSLPMSLGVETAREASIARIAPQLRSAYLSQNNAAALIEIIPQENVSSGELMRFVREIRLVNPATVGVTSPVRLRVGGLPALNADYQDAIGGSVLNIILLIVTASFAVLFISFRSLLGALKAVVLNLFSVGAAMGVTVLVFQNGYGAAWLGVAQPLDGLFPAVPIIVFCVVFGLSMDYEVFLLSRVAEGVRNSKSNREALISGLAHTGGIITSAALVMIIVFAGFSLGDFLVIKILGFALAVAILIDATLVRLAIGPALLQLGGRWNWWPGHLQSMPTDKK